MTYRNHYIKGWYSASCGGVTALAKEGLNYHAPEPAYLQSVECPERQFISPAVLNWQHSFTSSEINAALMKAGQKGVGTVTKIQVVQQTKTHRAELVKVTGSAGTVTVNGADLRINIDPIKMRSIWLTGLTVSRGVVTMKGRGFGHGVGLCQWGAYALAKLGKTPQQIVKFYYPQTQLEKIW